MCCWLTCTPAAPTKNSPPPGLLPCCGGSTRSRWWTSNASASLPSCWPTCVASTGTYRHIKTASQAIRTVVREHGTTLTQLYGVGPVLAAKLLGHAGDITRFPDRDHFASYTGTAPVEASSGDLRRHRLNRGGNRQLNTALHLIAVCQIRDPSPGQAYYRRKLAQAKTPEEARRSLKRHLANVVDGHLVTDHRHRTRAC
jgi:Transposase IS116/IS110/IS902 family